LSKEDFTKMYHDIITNQPTTISQTGFHIVTVYKAAPTPRHATEALKHASPYLFNVMIDANWRRKNIRRAFQMFAFLDDPGSRHRSPNNVLPIASAQDSYHHHSILVAPTWIGDRARERLHLDAEPLTVDPTSSTLRQTISKAIGRQSLSPSSFARTYLSSARVRSCFIRHLGTAVDIEHAAKYASKSATRLAELFPDDFFHILPLTS
jgi:hypothetical protein